MKKRILGFVLFLSIFFSMSISTFATQINNNRDFDNRWTDNVITKWVEKSVINLNESQNFLPLEKIKPVDFVSLVNKALNTNISNDIKGNEITRQDAAIILAKALLLETKNNAKTDFLDDSKISISAKSYVAALANKGIYLGDTQGYFNPTKAVTKEIAVLLIDRAYQSQLSYEQGTIETTRYGKVEGLFLNSDKTIAWLGVPYAKPPINDLRWKAPVPPSVWSGVLETKVASSKSAQVSSNKFSGSEDCLYLNIYRPNTSEEKLPVVVFVHGGNNQTGSGADQFDGQYLSANASCVVVTINYRLGALGWLNLPALKTGNPIDDSGNFGLLDIKESLTWISDNITAFGGNPDNVTLSGQSAGGRDVMAALISPLFDGKFHKAIAYSGGITTVTPEYGQKIATKAIAKWVVEDKIKPDEKSAIEWLNSARPEVTAYLRNQPAERIASIMTNALIRMEVFPHLFADGYVLPKNGFDVLKTGSYIQVPTILGSCATEFSLFTFYDPYFYAAASTGKLAENKELLAQYKFAEKYGSDLYASFNADQSAQILAGNKNQPNVYAYRFLWSKNLGGLGAFHSLDMDFVTGTTAALSKKLYNDKNKGGVADLTNSLQEYIKNFIYTSNPNGGNLVKWDAWSNQENSPKVLYLDADDNQAIIEMTNIFISPNDVLTQIDKDLLDKDLKNAVIKKILMGRFFSQPIDQKYAN